MASGEGCEPGVRLLFVRHGNALRPSERGPDQKADPPLSEQGKGQAAALVDRLAPMIEAATKVRMISSPMLRCLHTAAPTATALGLELLVHGEFFEYGCAGAEFGGSSFGQIREGLADSHGLTTLRATHFKTEDGLWLYEGSSDKEQPVEAKQRVERLGGWVRDTLVPWLQPGGLGVVVAHQTLIDLLLLLLLDDAIEAWTYGQPRYKLKNADLVEVEAIHDQHGNLQFRALSPPKHPPTQPQRQSSQLGEVFSQWANGPSEQAEEQVDRGPLDAGLLFRNWASSVKQPDLEPEPEPEPIDPNSLFRRWSEQATAQHVELGCVYRTHGLRRGIRCIREELHIARQNHAAMLEARVRKQQQLAEPID